MLPNAILSRPFSQWLIRYVAPHSIDEHLRIIADFSGELVCRFACWLAEWGIEDEESIGPCGAVSQQWDRSSKGQHKHGRERRRWSDRGSHSIWKPTSPPHKWSAYRRSQEPEVGEPALQSTNSTRTDVANKRSSRIQSQSEFRGQLIKPRLGAGANGAKEKIISNATGWGSRRSERRERCQEGRRRRSDQHPLASANGAEELEIHKVTTFRENSDARCL